MRKVNDLHKAITKSGPATSCWLPLLHWLRLLVLSLTRIKVYLAGVYFHEPAISSQTDILLGTATKTKRIRKPKLTGMKPAHRYIKLGIMFLFMFFAKFATAQSGPFQFTGDDNVCLGQTKSYGVTKVDGSTYAWTITPGTNGTDWVLTTSDNIITVQWLKEGAYKISVIETNLSGCASDAVEINVTVNPLPTVNVNSPTVCAGTLATITATPGAPGTYSYLWTVPAGVPDPGNVASFTSGVAGSYSVVITNTETGCSSLPASGTVTVNELPVCSITGNNNVCPGSTNTYDAPSGMSTYEWSISGNATIVGASDGQTVSVLANNICGSFTLTLTITNANGCISTCNQTYDITTPPVVLTPPADVTETSCQTQAQIDAAYATWLAGVTSSGGCTLTVTNDAPVAAPSACGGTITVTWTAKSPCEADVIKTATFTVTPPTPVVITAPVATTVNACDYADQAALDAAFQAWLATASVSGGCKPVLTNNAAGAGVLCTGGAITVTFTATDLCESPTATATFTVTPPTPVVITAPVATTVNACDYADQAALDAAFQAWLATASVSGGCKPVLTNNAAGAGVLCTGGAITVTFTATDLCESPTATATFTVTPPTPVVITAPVATTVNACDYADQAALDAAFQAWLATASVSGGCKPVLTNNAAGAGVLCTGGAITVTFTATDLCESPTATATFTVTPPTPVVITAPVATTVNACDYADQAALDAAFQAWLATASVSGGCKPVLTNNAAGAGVLCTGGAITVTFTATDLCESPTATATFTVTPPTPVVITAPVATTVNACDYADQAALDAAFQAWLATASVSGGCKPVLTNNAAGAGVLCTGGAITVTFTATDLCESPTATATFTVTPPTPVVITAPVATTVNACDYADQAALDAAFQAWLATASVSGGCKPVLTNNAAGAGVLCTGGAITVTFTATDLCESPTATATFTVTPPTPVVITAPVATTVNACDYADQAALDAAFQAWLATASVSGGCKPVLTNNAAGAGVLCTGGAITVTFTATDLCESPTATATFTVTPPTPVVITAPVATTVNACDYADQAALDAAFQAWLATASVSGGCKPVLTNNAAGAGVLCTGGAITVTFTATDLCESPTATATFTVTPPTPVVITAPVATTVNACDYADQAALDAAFQAWLATASVSGGCKPVLTNNAAGAGVLCTGGAITVTFTATDLCESPTATATFTVTPPTPVVITAPVATTVNACDYADQAALDAAFQAWLATASVSGGCKPVLTNNAAGAGVLCTGGAITVTFTATDLCESPTATATFTVTPPTPVVITAPVATTVNACDYADQAALDAAFQAWLATASVSGGCKPVLTNNAAGAGVLCTGGAITVTFTATDLCESPTATATFTVTPPTPVVITAPVATTVNACDYADQAALDAAFQAWLATASVSGGCKPVLTNNAAGAGVLCTGGAITVTFTATDLCESPTATATFTVTPPTPVVITAPVATTVNACDYADQAALDAAFQAWLATASVSGGCKPVLTNNAAGAGVLCTGGAITVTFTATDLCESPTATATFTVTPPTPVVITAPVATTVNACDYADQAALDAAFQAWLATASVSGGCKPVLTNNAAGAGVLCTGGAITVTFTATDLCESPTATATFTVTPPTPVVITAPVATTVNACDYADQAALDAAFQAWLATASVSGGCKPVLTNNAAGAGVLCTGGAITVTFTATDLCESPTATATFTVTPPTPVVITAPVATTVNACDYADQAALDAAFQAWLATASVSGGCKPVLTNNAAGAGVLCTGGAITVTFTATDLCESPTATATFTVTPPTPVVITAPVATTVNACDYADQAALDAAFQAWLATASVSGGCKPVLTNNAAGAGVLCTGGAITVTFTATDLCESPTATATFTVTPPTPVVITAPVATTVNACDYADQAALDAAFQAWLATASVSGGCKPVLTNNAAGAGVLCTGGAITVTFTATDLCESPTATATFTVTPPTPVVITAPVATTVNACDYADQAALDAAFQAWLATASVSGGCKPVLTNNAAGAGVLCTGGAITVTFTATDLCESPTATATFTVTPPTPVVITAPVATTVNACDYADQAALDAAFQAWLATASVSGGCKPVLTNNAAGAGVLCTGGAITVTFTATDLCESPTATATFTVTPPTPVVITAPVATTVNACDYADQAALDAAFQAWLATASVSGGCKPVLTNNAAGAGVLCTGGAITVTFTATDLCESPTATATFTVTPPTPVVITAPVATTVNACDYADQAALDAAFQAWLATASVSGGCKPVLTNNAAGAGVLCTGGAITVTFTATDLCESPTATATFTVTPPTPVVITAPVATTVNACDYADQAALDAAFQAWLATASVSGGCKPVLTNNAAGAGVLCTGGAITVTFTATDLCESPTATATFTVTPPTPVVITAPVATTVNACDYADQAALDAAFQAWLATASVSGGCKPVLTNNAAGAGVLCTGGAITVTFTATDLCESPTATATFTVTPPTPVVITAPVATTVNACDYADQAALDAAFQAWLATASVSGGCKPVLTNNAAGAGVLCTGGAITVTFTATDLCESPTATATFTVTPPTPVVITAPVATTVNACDYADQAALDAAFQAWLATASVSGGCKPVLTNNAAGAGVLCTGGAITVTFTATDLCESPTATATFTVTPPTPVVITAPVATTVNACDYADQAALDAAFQAWLATASVSGGCKPVLTNNAAGAGVLCTGGAITVTFTATDLCESPTATATFTVTPPTPVVITAPVATTVNACDYADQAALDAAFQAWLATASVSGGCKPVLTNNAAGAGVLCTGGAITVTFTATDLCESPTATATFTVTPPTPVVITAPVATTVNACDYADQAALDAAFQAWLATASVSGGCKPVLTNNAAGAGVLCTGGAITVTFTATDLCESPTATATFTVTPPTPVVITAPVATTVNACDYADQAALDAAFQAWLATASVSGGCKPVLTNNAAGAGVLCTGGAITVTFTATDLCESPTATATFTVTPPTPVVITAPVATTVNACDYADQAALDAAFQAWLATASVSGGCKPVLTNNAAGAGVLCTGGAITVTFTATDLCESPTATATFTVTPPTPVVITAPVATTVNACDYADQAALDAAFQAWLATASVSGGCKPVLTNNAAGAGVLCTGGAITVTFTATDLCESPTATATFTVTPPTPVVITAPVATTVNACDYADQAALDAAFQAWLATASVSGGCKPVLTNNAAGAGVLCTGGAITVTFTATDLCESPTATATFTVTPPTPVVITAPVATTVNACDYADQAALDAAFQAWLATASVSGGCKPVLTNNAAGAGVLCTGGAITVTFTATDLCESPTATATFTVTPPTPVVITAPVATTVNACDYADQAALDAAFQAWLATASVSGGCKPVLTNNAAGAGVLCTGGAITVTFTATDLCESPTATATFTVTPPTPVVITAPVATTVNACDYADQAALDAAFQAWLATASVSGGCKPVLTNNAAGAGVLCTGGAITVTFTATDLCESPTATATFTVTPPTPVVITAPVATTVNACDYADQAALDAAFQAWLATASVSGGCKPVLTNNAAGAGVLCTGGAITVTFTATDLCESPTATATFTVTPPTPVVITAPVATTVNACDYADQAALDAAFQAWLATASVSGGCKPVLTNNAAGAGVLCTGGAITVTFTATDLCESPTATATFTVTPPTPVVITAPVATTVNACDYADQAALDAAFQAWLATASVSGGCKPVLTNNAAGAGVLCTGGAITVTFTATDLCESPTATATFTVTPPTPVVITAPVATTVNACDYADQAALDAAFQAWLATASVSGGCKPVLTNNAAGAGVLCTGGAITVTFTATDLCESPTATATFTVTPPTPVVITAPVATTVNACDYADQAALDAAFQAWLATASVSGGCKPVLTNNAAGAGVLCTGGAITVTFTATDLCESPTATATFTVTPPTPVVITAPVATTVNACDYADQAALDAAFQAWLATASVSGGCKPVLTNNAAGAGVLCTGGAITVTFTATDLCESPTATATFTVTPPTPVVITAPVATTVNACDYADQAALDAAFQAWLATASVSGGCKPVLTNNAAGAGVLCTGGAITVTFTATDLCESPTATATFTVTPPTPVVITAPVATTVNACDYADQAALDAAFQAWLATASVSGGCKPVLTNNAAGAGVLCTGGAITVTFTATDLCESPTATATFTVTPPTPVVITAPVATTVNACDYADQAALDAAFQAWLATASVSGGCKPVLTNNAAGAGVLCTGGAITVTFTATDLCESPTATATFTVTPPTPVVITAPVATTVNACDYADQAALDAAFQAWLATASVSGGCKPVLTNNAAGAGVLCTGGAITVTFTATDLCESPTATATFTVTPPTPVVITAPVATTVNACDYADQAALDAAFQAWLATASVSGGCKPVLTNNAAGAGVLCTGGAITVTFTATDLCESPTATATFTVTPPTPVVITAPVATTVNACDYADQAALDAAFQAWLATASVSGGCKPVLTNNAAGAGVLCTGGAITVTFTATDLCESPTATATFTVTPPTPVVITAPVATTVNACDYADQAALDAAFQAWLATASVSGGCKPVLTNNAAGAGVLCTGGAITVTFTATDLCESPTATATFTVTPPTPVVITAPVATTVNACDYADQAALDAAFQAWLATASVSGGCKPVLTNNAAGAGVLCTGGAITVTFTATDLCESPTATATFTVTPPTPVVITAPVATTVNACDYADQAALDAAFQAWLATASVSGGCKPVLTNNAAGAGVLCTGGAITVTFTATDLCESPTATATFTVTPPTPVVITAPVATTVNACDYADQAALDAAFQAWLATASVSGGCKPVLTNNAAGAGVLCTGGAITVTFTATDLCESPTATATFTVTPPTPVVITAPVATTVNACDYADQAALDAAFQAWLATASVSGGCKPVLTNNAAGAGVLCTGGAITVTFTATDLCESPTATATFTVTPPTPVVITAPVATTVNACDYADQAALDAAFQAWLATASVSGGCKPVLTNNAAGAGVLCTGGAITVTFTATDLCESPTATATFTVTPPTPVVITAPVATTVNACDYADQAALDAAFQAWLATASVSGGCKPVLTNNAAGAGVLCTGGAITVTFTATDLCESPTATATFTVTPPTPVVITAPVATTVNACDYADQAALDAAFQAWLATASVSGGCKPVLTNNAAGAGVLCTGGAITVTFTATDLCESPTATATFTVTPPTPVVITAPVATTVNACDYADQAALDAAFQAWLATASVSGGCKPVLTNNAAGAGVLCTGGAITVTFTATDLCESPTATATFTVTPPTPVVITAPVATTVNACDYADQAALDAAFQAWLATASVSGGCKPVLTNNAAGAGVLCTGGAITVTFTATDLCESPTATATFTVTPPTPVVITCPPSQTFCEIADGNYTIPALIATDGCSRPLTISYEITGATIRSGTGTDASGIFNVGLSTITWTVTDACGNTATCTTSVTINPLPTPVITPSEDPVCANTGTVTYSTPEVGCNTYSWTVSAGGTIIGSSTGSSIVVQWTTSGIKTVTVTETMCGTGCSKTINKDFLVNPKPITTPITHN